MCKYAHRLIHLLCGRTSFNTRLIAFIRCLGSFWTNCDRLNKYTVLFVEILEVKTVTWTERNVCTLNFQTRCGANSYVQIAAYCWPGKSGDDFQLVKKLRHRRRRRRAGWGEYDVIGVTWSLIGIVSDTLHCARAESPRRASQHRRHRAAV